MSIAILASAMSARAGRAASGADRAIRRFAPEIRGAIADACARDARLADLASSFPALLHRIALDEAREAERLVLSGAPLKQAAAAARLPYWTRRLPPEAFGRASHALPDGEGFSRRILNWLPDAPRDARDWLEAVAAAARWGEDDFVVWVACECARAPRSIRPARIPSLALFAWYSLRPELAASLLQRERWSMNLKAPGAWERTLDWLASIELAVSLGAGAIDPWFKPGHADGFEFAPLVSREALLEEAFAMDNCLRSYGGSISGDCERVVGVRRDGERVATLSIEFGQAPFPRISQLVGPCNSDAPDEIWYAARSWLDSHGAVAKRESRWVVRLDRTVWIELWKPYWLYRGRLPAELPLAPSVDAFEALCGRLRRRRPRPRRRRAAR